MRRLLVVALMTVAVGGRAHGYVRTVIGGKQVYWQETCPTVTIYLNKFEHSNANQGMSVDAIVKSIAAAAHTWSPDAVTARASELGVSSCQGGGPFLEIVPTLAPETATPPPATGDARNSIIFRTDVWSKSGQLAGFAYAAEGLAVTTVTSEPDGHITDVDIEINAANPATIRWMNLDPGTPVPGTKNGDSNTPPIYDLQNALTHEFGHFIGLAHTCFSPIEPGSNVDGNLMMRPNDDMGRPVPDCGALNTPSYVSSSVMYYAENNYLDTSRRVLSADDLNAVCTIYAPSNLHEVCPLDQVAPSCSVAPRSRAPWARGLGAAIVTALLAVAARRRARRRGRVSAPARARA